MRCVVRPLNLALMLLFVLPFRVLAQTSVADVVGIPPDAAIYKIPGVGFVNLNNGNLHLEIPVRSVKDRDNVTRVYSIRYDSGVYRINQGLNGQGTTYYWAVMPPPSQNTWGVNLSVYANPGFILNTQYTYILYACGSSQIPQYTNWQFTDDHGTIHTFPAGLLTERGNGTGCPDIPSIQAAATDGSGYWLEVTNYTSAVVYDAHGNIANGGEDTNGNYGEDNLGRSVNLPSGFTLKYKTINVWTDFAWPAIAEMGVAGAPASGPVLSSLVLPDGRSYSFQYDEAGTPAQQGHYGGLTSITLPTGGQISVTMEALPASYEGYAPAYVVRQISTPDGTWSFSYSNTTGMVTATAPKDSHTGLASQTTCSGGNGITQTVSIYPGTASGTPLRKIVTQYNDFRPSSVTTTLDNGQASQVVFTYADACTPRVATKKEYDFSGVLLRETDVNYLTSASDNSYLCQQWNGTPPWTTQYLQNNHHITDIPSSVTVYGPSGSSGSPIAQTMYTYDSTALSTTSGPIGTGSSVLGLPVHDDVNFGASMTIRGNPTVISQMRIPGTFITTRTSYYNVLGELVKSVDGNGNASSYDFTDKWNDATCISKPMYAYPTTVTNALGQLSTSTYNSCDGSVASVKDQNDINASRAGIGYTYDGLQRITQVSYPDGGTQQTSYGGSAVPEVITTTTAINSSMSETSTMTLDGLGRQVHFALTSDPSGTDYTDTIYDTLGRIGSVSNPYHTTSDPTYGITTYAYDGLSRTTQVTHPDNAYISTSYTGRAADVVDETRTVERVSQVDGLGRLTSVCEVTSVTELGPGGTPAPCTGQDITKTGFLTTYGYDALGNLLSVSQGTLGQRTFAYDGLSRLLCAANPETWLATCPNPDKGTYTAGTTRYSYDANGNVITRTRPAPNQTSASTTVATSYSYDALNRLTKESYSDGVTLPALFGYDQTNITMGSQQFTIANSIGRLSWSCTQLPSGYCNGTMNANSYDALGRIAEIWQENPVNGNNIFVAYGYDLLGDETNRNLSGNTYAATYDTAGRLTGFTATDYTDATNPANLLTGVHYDAFGHMISGSLANGLSSSSAYDARGRVTAMAVGTNCSAGNCSTNKYRFTTAYFPNSNIASSTDTVNANWTYTYDDLNRLSTALANNGEGCSWDYDRYGNRLHQNAHSGSCLSSQYSVTGNNNHLDGLNYDAAGNVLNDGSHRYLYDAENRITSVDNGATTYTYDAEGRRVAKTTGGSLTDFIYDREGHVILYNVSTGGVAGAPLIESYVAGMHLGTYVLNSTVTDTIFYYDHSDWLGTERARTDLSGTPCETIANLPFGDNQTIHSTCGDLSPLHFTGKERDAESGLDDFGFRYFGSSLGRFMTPDEPFYDGDIHDPQKLNLYSYVRNSPTTSIDPDGHRVEICDTNGQNCTSISNDAYATAQQQDQYNHAPTLDQLQRTEGESQNIKDSNGNVVGTATRINDENAPVEGITPLGERYLAGYAMGAGVGRALGAAWGAVAGWFGRGAETVGATAGRATFQDILQGAVEESGQATKSGGIAQATKDFEALEGQSQNLGRVQMKELPDGGKAVLRNFSKDGRPTLEYQPASGGSKTQWIRYNP